MNTSQSNIRKIFITGGAGFIGSCLARYLVENRDYQILVYDKLTYAGNLKSLDSIIKNTRFNFVQGDICDLKSTRDTITNFGPDIIVHLAAETHVDKSIVEPQSFINTNIVGTSILLQSTLKYWDSLQLERKKTFRFHHISTDEVFGSLDDFGLFDEDTKYDPKSPYSASKAASDHLVKAWNHTYGLPTIITNCSNNYGPYQFPEKLIPSTIIRALSDKVLPIYGKGENIRDWIFVEDHVRAICNVFESADPGSIYLVSGNSERRNIDVVNLICKFLDKLCPKADNKSYIEQISFVVDRPGHDYRYAIDDTKINKELGFLQKISFEEGLFKTIIWYIQNKHWWKTLLK